MKVIFLSDGFSRLPVWEEAEWEEVVHDYGPKATHSTFNFHCRQSQLNRHDCRRMEVFALTV